MSVFAPDLGYGFTRWKSVIFGLMVREVRCRYASGNIGYAWAFLMPAAWIGGLILFFAFLNHRPSVQVPVPYFVATGMLPYVIFRQTITGMTRALSANRSLIGFSGIRPADVFFAFACLELLNAALLCSSMLLILGLIYGPMEMHDIAGFITGIVLAWLLGASFGRLAAILGGSSDFVARILPIALRPMFWISGIFFTTAELPVQLANIFWFNPLLHIVELVRTSAFGGLQDTFINPLVPFLAISFFYLAATALLLRGGWQNHRLGWQ